MIAQIIGVLKMIITITGKPCSGKSTIAQILVEKHGFTKIGVGDLFKEEAKKHGMSAEEFNSFCMKDPSFDFFLDQQTAKLGKELEGQKVIFDSRLAWHFVPKSFKVFVDLNDDETAQRLLSSNRTGKEKYNTLEEAKSSLINRRNLEKERYKLIYNIDYTDPKNYDFVIDSSNKTPEELADIIWKNYIEFCENSKNQ